MGPSPLSPSPCLRKRLLSGTSQGVLQKDAKSSDSSTSFSTGGYCRLHKRDFTSSSRKINKTNELELTTKIQHLSYRGMFLWSPHQRTNTTGFAVLCGDSQEMCELLVLLCKSPNELELKGKVTGVGRQGK